MRRLPYSTYKDSGIDSLGQIPSHWEVRRLKTVLERNDGGVWGDDFDPHGTIVLRSTEQTLDGKWQIDEPARRSLTGAEEASALLREGDILITKSSGSALHIGKATIVTPEVAALRCCFSNFMQRIRCDPSTCPQYVYYFLRSCNARAQLAQAANTTTGLANLTRGIIGNVLSSLPPLDVQRAIAAFLDGETDRIDALIAKKQRQVELLQEKRAALITRAATKGLDPNTPMKGSGVEWLGRIPAHWQAIQLKRRWRVVDCKHRTATYTDEGIPIVSTTEVKPGRLDLSNTRRTSEAEYRDLTEGRMPKRGDIIYSRNASVGSAAYVDTDEPFCMGQDVCLITSADQDQLFLCYQLCSQVAIAQLESVMIGSTFRRINVEQIKHFWVTGPPVGEQRDIAAYLDLECTSLDSAVAKVRESSNLLREYRAALISAAVTGKIDVREELT